MSNHPYVVHGPPGTGKTHFLTLQAARAAEKYGSDRVQIVSLTRTAAAEIRTRVEGVPEHNCGTLHSRCLRGLGVKRGELTADKDFLEAWNAAHPDYAMGKIAEDPEGAGGMAIDPLADDRLGLDSGADLLQAADVLRHQRRHEALWPTEVLEFHRKWTEFKRAQGRRDFTDLIEMALLDVPAPPGDCRVLIVDEAQDLSALENALVRQWTRHTDQTVVAGDADQTLYGWRGAEPTFFLPDSVPEDHVRVLHQSYRVPQAAHRVAMEIITPCEGRYPTKYLPTQEPGTVELGGPTFRHNADELADMAAEHARDPERGSVMLIAPCGFQLFPLLAELRAKGVPFHNPFRATHGAWNPLPRGRKDAVTFSERLEAFTVPSRLGRGWSQDEFTHWASQLTAEFLRRGVKSEIKEGTLRAPRTVDELRAIFRNAADAERALSGDLDWFVSAISPAGKKSAEYPLRVIRAFGVQGIVDKPRVIVGTIHSVKGGQAGRVVVCPDMSKRGADELANNEDSIRRLFYVAVTRTQGGLMMTNPGGRLYANFW